MDAMAATAPGTGETTAMTTVLVGVDHSEHSYYALERAVFFVASSMRPDATKVVAVHARRPPASAFISLDAVARVRSMEDTEQSTMEKLMEDKARQLSSQYAVDIELEVRNGEPKRVLFDAVAAHRADVLIIGTHGYGPILRVLFGSVSDYCCHHASCPVMVVKKP